MIPALYGAVAMTTLQVQVLSPGGRPVDRASVIITFVEGREPMKLYKKHVLHWELKTNQQGIAKIPPIPQGKIKVQIIASNYQTFGDFFPVQEAEKTITIQLKDPQQQYSAHGDNDPTKPAK
jgi:hypothetical protein